MTKALLLNSEKYMSNKKAPRRVLFRKYELCAAISGRKFCQQRTVGSTLCRPSCVAIPTHISDKRYTVLERIVTIAGRQHQCSVRARSRSVSDCNFPVCCIDGNRCNITGCPGSTSQRQRRGQTQRLRRERKNWTIGESFRYCCFNAGCHAQALSYFRTHRVILVRRQRYGGQDADDRHNDHQFDQGKTLLQITFHKHSLEPVTAIKPAEKFPR